MVVGFLDNRPPPKGVAGSRALRKRRLQRKERLSLSRPYWTPVDAVNNAEESSSTSMTANSTAAARTENSEVAGGPSSKDDSTIISTTIAVQSKVLVDKAGENSITDRKKSLDLLARNLNPKTPAPKAENAACNKAASDDLDFPDVDDEDSPTAKNNSRNSASAAIAIGVVEEVNDEFSATGTIATAPHHHNSMGYSARRLAETDQSSTAISASAVPGGKQASFVPEENGIPTETSPVTFSMRNNETSHFKLSQQQQQIDFLQESLNQKEKEVQKVQRELLERKQEAQRIREEANEKQKQQCKRYAEELEKKRKSREERYCAQFRDKIKEVKEGHERVVSELTKKHEAELAAALQRLEAQHLEKTARLQNESEKLKARLQNEHDKKAAEALQPDRVEPGSMDLVKQLMRVEDEFAAIMKQHSETTKIRRTRRSSAVVVTKARRSPRKHQGSTNSSMGTVATRCDRSSAPITITAGLLDQQAKLCKANMQQIQVALRSSVSEMKHLQSFVKIYDQSVKGKNDDGIPRQSTNAGTGTASSPFSKAKTNRLPRKSVKQLSGSKRAAGQRQECYARSKMQPTLKRQRQEGLSNNNASTAFSFESQATTSSRLSQNSKAITERPSSRGSTRTTESQDSRVENLEYNTMRPPKNGSSTVSAPKTSPTDKQPQEPHAGTIRVVDRQCCGQSWLSAFFAGSAGGTIAKSSEAQGPPNGTVSSTAGGFDGKRNSRVATDAAAAKGPRAAGQSTKAYFCPDLNSETRQGQQRRPDPDGRLGCSTMPRRKKVLAFASVTRQPRQPPSQTNNKSYVGQQPGERPTSAHPGPSAPPSQKAGPPIHRMQQAGAVKQVEQRQLPSLGQGERQQMSSASGNTTGTQRTIRKLVIETSDDDSSLASGKQKVASL